MRKNKGFTLVEILIVVAIIGILASIILVGLNSFRSSGRDARRIADVHQVQNALELYFTKNGSYPAAASWAALTSTIIGAGIGVNTLPNDPTVGRSYGYCNPVGDQSRYALGAYLEDNGNPSLLYAVGTTFPCDPTVTSLSNPACSVSGAVTNKYCVSL